MKIRIRTHTNRVVRTLFTMLAGLVMLQGVIAVGHIRLGLELAALTDLADMDLEANLPTIYNVLLFFVGAVLFLLMGRTEQGRIRQAWNVMTGVFIFLAFDEGAQIHEKFMLVTWHMLDGMRQADGTLGILYYAWFIPYLAVVLFMGLLLLPWFVQLDRRLRIGFHISGAIYLSGAVVMEAYSGKLAESMLAFALPGEHYPWMPCFLYPTEQCILYTQPAYVLAYTLEETLEMTGLIICIGFLLDGLERRGVRLRVDFGSNPAGTVHQGQ